MSASAAVSYRALGCLILSDGSGKSKTKTDSWSREDWVHCYTPHVQSNEEGIDVAKISEYQKTFHKISACETKCCLKSKGMTTRWLMKIKNFWTNWFLPISQLLWITSFISVIRTILGALWCHIAQPFNNRIFRFLVIIHQNVNGDNRGRHLSDICMLV